MLDTSTPRHLDTSTTPTLDTSPASDSVLVTRDLIERLQAELKFKQTKIEALNFEIARLKRWRRGASARWPRAWTPAPRPCCSGPSWTTPRGEDAAAKNATQLAPAAAGVKGQSVRQALPVGLPLVDRHGDLGATHCACGQARQAHRR